MIKKALIVFFLAMIFTACTNGQKDQPPPHEKKRDQPVKKDLPKFDGAYAFSILQKQVDFGPRNPNSTGQQRCLDFLSAEIRKYTNDVRTQPFQITGYGGEVLHLTNIFASFRPEFKERILFLAHWDTRPRADMEKDPSKKNQPILGANDGASGVAVLMGLAQLLSQQQPDIGVDILFVDGEDYGMSTDLHYFFLGSKYFVQNRKSDYSPRFAILLDMVGDTDLRLPIEQNSAAYAPQVVDLIWSTAAQLGIPEFVNISGEAIQDDHIPFNEAGIPTVDIIDFEYPYWHTAADTPDKCSARSLEQVGRVITSIVYSMTPSIR